MKRIFVLVAIAFLAAGCGETVTGTPRPEGADLGDFGNANEKFRNLLTECDAVADDQIAKAVGGDSIQRGFFGAICRWDVGGPGGNVKVTFNWFESGSLNNEKATLEKLKYTISETKVEGRRAIQQQRPNDPDSCGITAGAPDQGIIGWWVNYRPGSAHPDPCQAAVKLAELTLNLTR